MGGLISRGCARLKRNERKSTSEQVSKSNFIDDGEYNEQERGIVIL